MTPTNKADTRFPYRFAPREAGERFTPLAEDEVGKFPFHDRLNAGHYDVALEVEWVTMTPVAANPCSDPDPGIPPCCPDNADHNEYTGYDKRWLRVGGKLAISPFTVKSAIANGFANLLGGCIRTPKEETPHANQGEGKYPYSGAYKRYRVSMDGKSKPGIIRSVNALSDGNEFEIEAVRKEFYSDQDPLPISITPGTTVVALIEPQRNRYKPWKVVDVKNLADRSLLCPKGAQKIEDVIYCGPYTWGMNPYTAGSRSVFGRTKPWRHRFYTLHSPAITVKGKIPSWQFGALPDLESKMFMGRDQIKNPPDPNHRWFQKIDDLKASDWVYYEEFSGQVVHIGKSFLFKAAFHHPDTVPSGQRECKDMRSVCPRCAMFGMTDDTKRDDKPAVGYRGRFKASALVCDEILKEVENTEEIVPVKNGDEYRGQPFPVKAWSDANGNICCRQFLLPIQGQPKPNKQDTDGYFDPKTGLVKGVKIYRHSIQDIAKLKDLKKFIEKTDTKQTLADSQPALFIPNDDERNRLGALKYSHNLRSWAEVCDAGMTFRGTLGGENCSEDEIAAIVLLLESGLPGTGHGFKIGTGKALGLGSVESHIKKVWIRKPDAYEKWLPIEVATSQDLETGLEKHLPEVKDALKRLMAVGEFERKINQMVKNGRSIAYPPPGIRYWERYAKPTGLNDMP